jgi:hypothetical protein
VEGRKFSGEKEFKEKRRGREERKDFVERGI